MFGSAVGKKSGIRKAEADASKNALPKWRSLMIQCTLRGAFDNAEDEEEEDEENEVEGRASADGGKDDEDDDADADDEGASSDGNGKAF